ncbi:DMT family transporter [Thermocatellispora tengchongensis]|uniref:DMT family transporter n=1 Tax=Thermocatellispora tengchongensis TaxID=1073253 RepID=UPI00363DBDBD
MTCHCCTNHVIARRERRPPVTLSARKPATDKPRSDVTNPEWNRTNPSAWSDIAVAIGSGMLRAMAVSAPRPLLGAVLLLFVSAAWGSAFPLMKDLIVRMPVADLLTERYGLAALVLFAIRPRAFRGLRQGTWTRGIVLGLLFGVGQTAQAVALQSLPSPVSGFAVGCNVVMTPLLGLVLLRVRVSKRVWAAVALSAIAMAAFTLLQGYEGGDVSVLALTATLMAAALYAVHTLVLGLVSTKRYDSYAITVIQLGTIALMTGVVAAPGGLTLPRGPGDWAVLSHLALVSCALGFLARTYAQAHVSAVPTAVLLASQPLWVALFAVLGYGESITWSMVLGGVLVAIAMLLVVEPGRPQDLAAAAAPGPGADPPGLATPPPASPPSRGGRGPRGHRVLLRRLRRGRDRHRGRTARTPHPRSHARLADPARPAGRTGRTGMSRTAPAGAVRDLLRAAPDE